MTAPKRVASLVGGSRGAVDRRSEAGVNPRLLFGALWPRFPISKPDSGRPAQQPFGWCLGRTVIATIRGPRCGPGSTLYRLQRS